MTWDERVDAVAAYGFTRRQAAFLVTVMLHTGVCLGRHYAAFAGISHGQKVQDFFRTLLARRYASVRRCSHNRANLFHIHHKRLYEAIGESNNRNRRALPLGRAVERLMILDAVFADRTLEWLATEQDKVAYFTLTQRIDRGSLPSLTFTSGTKRTVRYFPDKLPVGIGTDTRTFVFLYLVTKPVPVDFRAFLERHAELWRALPAWGLRLLIPHHLRRALDLFRRAFREQIGTPLRSAHVEELRWYFHARRDGVVTRDARFERAARAFGAPRFRTLYRAWLDRGDSVVDATISPALANAIARQTGQLDTCVLAHRYLHLGGLVGTS